MARSIYVADRQARYQILFPRNRGPRTIGLSFGNVRFIPGSVQTLQLGEGDVAKLYHEIDGIRLIPVLRRPLTMTIPVGAVEVEINAGPDGAFATSDDVVTIRGRSTPPEVPAHEEIAPSRVDEDPEAIEAPVEEETPVMGESESEKEKSQKKGSKAKKRGGKKT